MRRSKAVRDDQFRAYVFARRGTLLRTAALLTSGNAHLDEERRPYRRRERSHADLPEIQAESPPDVTDAAVFSALAELPPRMRAAVILRHLHDASVAETADALGCSEGTVKSQTARGLARLREALAGLQGSGARAADHTISEGATHE